MSELSLWWGGYVNSPKARSQIRAKARGFRFNAAHGVGPLLASTACGEVATRTADTAWGVSVTAVRTFLHFGNCLCGDGFGVPPYRRQGRSEP